MTKNKEFLSKDLQEDFEEILSQNGYDIKNAVDIPSGICVVNDSWTQAYVCMDGRYPKLEDGYSLNQVCIETITILKWIALLSIDWKTMYLHEWEFFAILPWMKYTITWMVIAKDDISPSRDSSQNSYVKI